MEKGILGMKTDPRKKMLLFANGGDWPSDDSNDSTYTPPGNNLLKMEKIKKRKHKKKKKKKQHYIIDPKEDVRNLSFSSHKTFGTTTLIFRKMKEKKEKKQTKKKSNWKTDVVNNSEPVEMQGNLIDSWGTLIPPEILLRIFQFVVDLEGALPFLTRAAKVCNLWNRITCHPSLWAHIDLSSGRVRRLEDKLVWLCENRLRQIKELNLSGWQGHLTHRGIKAISENCPHLSNINLSGCKISAKDVYLLAEKCGNLRALDLSQVTKRYTADTPVSHNSMKNLMSKCGQKFTHICLANNTISGISMIINTISEFCPNLRLLDLSNVVTTCRDTIAINIERVQQGCMHLQILRLANTMFRLSNVPLAEQANSLGFPELEELSIASTGNSYYAGIDDSALERILKNSRKLKLLDIRSCGRISASCLVRIPAWDLEHMFLSQCSAAVESELELIMRKWGHSLIEVDLSWNNNAGTVVDAAVNALASPEVSHLQVLDLCGSAVSYEPVKNILMKSSDLKVLNLSSCRGLPRGMKRLYKNEDLLQLREDIESARFVQFDDVT